MRNFPVSVKEIVLGENAIRRDTVYNIECCLNGSRRSSRTDLSAIEGDSSDSVSTVSSSVGAGMIIDKHSARLSAQKESGFDSDETDSSDNGEDTSSDAETLHEESGLDNEKEEENEEDKEVQRLTVPVQVGLERTSSSVGEGTDGPSPATVKFNV